MKYYLKIIFIAIICSSCQDEINLQLPNSERKIVVEGSIEPGYPPYVILTTNEGYFDQIPEDYPSNIYIEDADSVIVWYYSPSGEKITKILERISVNTLQFILGIDSIPPIYTVNDYNFFSSNENPYEFSQEERTYYLKVVWNNQIVTAETTIPKSTPLDCLWVEKNESAKRDYKCDIRAIYSDPADRENNLLIKSRRIQNYERNRKDTLICDTINYPDFPLKLVDSGSDILINGETFETYFPRPKESGFPTGTYNSAHYEICENGDTLAFKNDIVIIKFCQIDKESMKFWRGLTRQSGNNGNPFAEPLNLVSNINGGLGIWTGYSPVYYKVPIVKGESVYLPYQPKTILEIF